MKPVPVIKHFIVACKNHQCPFDCEIQSVSGLSSKGGESMCGEISFQPYPASTLSVAIKWLTGYAAWVNNSG
jgi:hypothetical protein